MHGAATQWAALNSTLEHAVRRRATAPGTAGPPPALAHADAGRVRLPVDVSRPWREDERP